VSAQVRPHGDDLTYVHEQTVASSTWTVVHNLGKKVSVTVVDSADTVVVGDVEYVNDNTVTVRFSAPFGGRVYCN
jgi:hypothetical protein